MQSLTGHTDMDLKCKNYSTKTQVLSENISLLCEQSKPQMAKVEEIPDKGDDLVVQQSKSANQIEVTITIMALDEGQRATTSVLIDSGCSKTCINRKYIDKLQLTR